MQAALGDELRDRLGPFFATSPEPLYVWRRDGEDDLVLVGYNEAATRLPHSRVDLLLGRRARDVYADLPDLVADFHAAVRGDGFSREMDYVFPMSGEARRLLVSFAPVPPDLLVVGTRDVTDWWNRVREERQRSRELEQVAEMTQALLATDDPREARQLLCATALGLAEADAVYLLERDGDDLAQTAVSRAPGAAVPAPLRRPVDSVWLAGAAYRDRERIFVPDLEADERSARDVDDAAGVHSGFFEPVVVGERTLGVLVVAWQHPSPGPPQRALRIMPVLASQAGAVIVRTDLIARLTDLAGRDPLTGLPNRRSWDEEVARTLSVARRHASPVCVVVLDVNGLKQVNDGQGHKAGDDLLRSAARLWQAQLRAEDLLARLGGDEFGVLVPGLRLEEAERIVGRLTGAGPHLSAAVGIAEWDGQESAEELVHRADAAMYVDKRRG